MEYVYQGLDPGSKVRYLLNGIRCDKLSTAAATVSVHPDKYEKDFDTVVTFLTQRKHQHQVWRLHLSPDQTCQVAEDKRPALAMALLEEKVS